MDAKSLSLIEWSPAKEKQPSRIDERVYRYNNKGVRKYVRSMNSVLKFIVFTLLISTVMGHLRSEEVSEMLTVGNTIRDEVAILELEAAQQTNERTEGWTGGRVEGANARTPPEPYRKLI